jgi:hypothetical protein
MDAPPSPQLCGSCLNSSRETKSLAARIASRILLPMQKYSKADIGFIASITLFFVFCGLIFFDLQSQRRLLNLSSESISPENLRGAAESFWLQLAVEKHSNKIEDISKSESWAKLEDRLSGYADRLDLIGRQQQQRQFVVLYIYVASSVAMLLFGIARLRTSRKQADQGGGGNTAGNIRVST